MLVNSRPFFCVTFLLGFLHDFGIMHRDLKVWEHVISFNLVFVITVEFVIVQ